MARKPIIAIDGPSGVGKTTASKAVAAQLGFTYIDTGAMYRAVGLLATRRGLPPEQTPELVSLLSDLDLRFERTNGAQRVIANGEDVSAAIREHAASAAASAFSRIPAVRTAMVAQQRKMGAAGAVVMEGRDIGSNVFPDAELKVFLTATPEVKAKRRYEELRARGEDVDYEKILQDQNLRDEADSNRSLNPLIQTEDARVLDTSDLDADQVVQTIVSWAREIMASAEKTS
ncbi:MAG: (d)CMP kinase [Deltaproteobacteria bacterium]|nr:(d)CMP kinase [Deltaproteobacteria bacterium]